MKLTRVHDHELPSGVLGLAVASDGERAWAACADGSIMEVDTASGATVAFAERHESFASGCVLMPDGSTLISAGYDGMLMWHDTATRRCWRRVRAHRFWNWQIALSPDGTRLATVTGQYLPGGWKYEPAPETEPSVKVFDTLTGDRVAAFSHVPPVLSCAFSRDGRWLAAAGMTGEVRVWELSASDDARPAVQWTTPDFTSWGSVKTHHYCGGIFALGFAPDDAALVCCGMGPMNDPMAGNGKMTWQRWAWRESPPRRIDQIHDGEHGSGLMEAFAWHPGGAHFLMAGRQAQGTWNAALFAAADGKLVHSLDTKSRITHTRFTPDGQSLVISAATGQGQRRPDGTWPRWGRIGVYRVET